jgi:hypothetical protein
MTPAERAALTVEIARRLPPELLMASKLGIQAPNECRWKSPLFRALLKKRNAAGWTDSDIARATGVDRHYVSIVRGAMGLPCNKFSDRRRKQVAKKTRQQCADAGVSSLAEIRAMAFRNYAKRHGWPEDVRWRAVQILNALWTHGPMTRREIADRVGMPWKGSRKSLVSSHPGGSYLAYLMARGLVVVIKRAVRRRGVGRSVDLYSLPLTIDRKESHDEGLSKVGRVRAAKVDGRAAIRGPGPGLRTGHSRHRQGTR